MTKARETLQCFLFVEEEEVALFLWEDLIDHYPEYCLTKGGSTDKVVGIILFNRCKFSVVELGHAILCSFPQIMLKC